MAITSSAKRAIRVSARKRVMNLRRTDAMKEGMKSLRKLSDAGKAAEAEKALASVYKAIDKAAKNGTIKKNTAARMKSRIMKNLRAVAA